MRRGKQHHSQGTQWRSTTQQRRRTAAPPKRREAHKGRGGKRHHPKREAEGEHHLTEVGSQAVPPKSGGEGKNTTMIKPESFRQRVSSHIRGWRSLFLSCEIMHEAHGIVRLHVECWIQPSSRHCVPPRYHWRTRACEQMVHTQHTYNGRLQMIKHTYVDALRRVATILHVCSYVLPSVYMFKVISFSRRTWNATFMLRKEFFLKKKKMFFFSVRACSSELVCRAIFLALSAKEQGWCVGFHLHLVATVVWRDIPSSWQKCWTIRDCHRQHYRRTWHHITLPLHSWTLPSHWQLTVSTFLRFSGSVNHHWNHWFPSSCSSFSSLHSSWSRLSGLIATTWRFFFPEDLNYDSNPKFDSSSMNFGWPSARSTTKFLLKPMDFVFSRQKNFFRKICRLRFTYVSLIDLIWSCFELSSSFVGFEGAVRDTFLPRLQTQSHIHTHTMLHNFLLFQCIFLFSNLWMLAHFLSFFETFSEVYNVLQFADTFKHVQKQDTLCTLSNKKKPMMFMNIFMFEFFFQEKTNSSNQLFV